MNWTTHSTPITPNITKYQIHQDKKILTFQNWINLMKTSQSFIHFYNDLLKNSKFEAFFWEVKPVTQDTLQDPFEFVLVNSTALKSIKADNLSFKKYFVSNKKVVSFPNLGGDAQLIVPTPDGDITNFSHLANFIRIPYNNTIVEFWEKVATQYEQAIGAQPKWLSTSGLGVHWLHVRIDSRPKYYQFQAYKHP